MIDYHTFSQIKDMQLRQDLKAAQIADALDLNIQTVCKYFLREKFVPRCGRVRGSKLDAFKPEIMRLLNHYAYSSEQIFKRIQAAGFEGGRSIVKSYVAEVRPAPIKAFLSIQYDKGECAQVDWGTYGTINTGCSSRKLSVFTMILGYSRTLFIYFTVSEKMEQFLECIRLGFNYFGGVPRKVVIDNLKTGVLSHQRGMPPVFHPRFAELGEHYGFKPTACNVRSPYEKGMVEKAVSFVKGNLLKGHEYPSLDTLQAAGVQWLNTVANDRIHSVTGKRPFDLLAEEKTQLTPINPMPYDTSVLKTMRASSQFRITLDTNRYSVPWRLAGKSLQVKICLDHISLFHDRKLVARHVRSYDRRRDFEHSDHVKDLLLRRKNAQSDKLLIRFLDLHPTVEEYYRELCERSVSAKQHVRKIMALEDLDGRDAVVKAIQTALHFKAFSSDYIRHLLEMSERTALDPGPLHLTTPGDALELDLEPPDLNRYTTK